LLAATGLLLAAVDASSRAHAAGAYGPDAGFGVNAAGLGGTALAALEVAPRLRDALGSGGRGLGVEGVALNSPIVSGLAWRSGASSNVDGTDETEFGEWRGRRVDVHVLFVEHDDWAQMTRFLTGSFFRGRVQQSPQPVVSLAMMPRSERKQHAACARGEFNARFQEFGRNLNAAEPPPLKWSILRYGFGPEEDRDATQEAQARGDRRQAAPGRRPGLARPGRGRRRALDRCDRGDLLPLAPGVRRLKTEQVRRLKQLEAENARLRRAVAELTLDKLILKEAASGNY
jgi:hypothetical protein